MIKLAIVAPHYNGLMKYSKPLYEKLKELLKDDFEIIYVGNDEMGFDKDYLDKKINKVCDEIIEFNPDIIHYNYGTYDADQLIPYFLDKRGFKTKKSILTYHSLQLDLFKKMNVPEYDLKANEYVGKMDEYVFFTEYARKQFEEKYNRNDEKYIINYHPATHKNDDITKDKEKEFDERFKIDKTKPIATVLGYPSHWKETRTIVKLANNFPQYNFVVAGPWWSDKFKKENENINLEQIKNLQVIDEELENDEFIYFMKLGIGLFPYDYFKSFQGSGLLPNYLYRGIGCIGNSIEPLKEYFKDNELCFDFKNEKILYENFEKIMNQKTIQKRNEFSYDEHAKKMIELYK